MLHDTPFPHKSPVTQLRAGVHLKFVAAAAPAGIRAAGPLHEPLWCTDRAGQKKKKRERGEHIECQEMKRLV